MVDHCLKQHQPIIVPGLECGIVERLCSSCPLLMLLRLCQSEDCWNQNKCMIYFLQVSVSGEGSICGKSQQTAAVSCKFNARCCTHRLVRCCSSVHYSDRGVPHHWWPRSTPQAKRNIRWLAKTQRHISLLGMHWFQASSGLHAPGRAHLNLPCM